MKKEQYKNKEWLRKKYLKEKVTLREIAEDQGVAYPTIIHWRKKLGIPVRKRGEHRVSKKEKQGTAGMIQKNRASGKLSSMSNGKARKLFEEWKRSYQSVTLFSRSKGYWSGGLREVFLHYFPDEYSLEIERREGKRNSWYKTGRQFEYQTRNYLRKHKFWVLRSPASKGPIDLVAISKEGNKDGRGKILLIQCKRGDNYLPSKEKKPLIDIANATGGIPILACRKSAQKFRFRKCLDKGYEEFKIE